MNKLVTGLTAIVGSLLIAAPAMARPIPSGGLTRQEMATWLLDQGYAAEVHNDSGGVSIVSSAIAGVNYDIYFHECTGARCASLEFLAGWSPADNVTLDELNAWNAKKRFVFGYRDTDRNLWAQYDIDVGTGASWEQLPTAMTRWEDGSKDFKSLIDRGGAPE